MHVVSLVQFALMGQCKYQGETVTSVIVNFDDRVNSYLCFCLNPTVNNVHNFLTPFNSVVGKIRDVTINTLEKILVHERLKSK